MENNKISIIIPVYNASSYIECCIKSILNQSCSNWELILVNDGSTDDSLEKCIAFQKNDKRIFVIDQKNSGPSVARNKGIEIATGKFIVFVDADDHVNEFYLEKLLQPFLSDFDIKLSCGGYIEFSKYHKIGLALHDFKDLLQSNLVIDQSVFFENLFKGVTGVLWGKMFSLDIIKKHKIVLNPDIRLSEDLLFVFEYTTHIKKIALVKEYLYYYNRLNENTLSGHLKLSNLNDIQLTNMQLETLNLKIKLPDMESIVNKRYSDGILKIIKDTSTSSISFKQKIKDFQFVREAIQGKIKKMQFMNIEDKLNMLFLDRKFFYVLIAFNTGLLFLRNLKNQI